MWPIIPFYYMNNDYMYNTFKNFENLDKIKCNMKPYENLKEITFKNIFFPMNEEINFFNKNENKLLKKIFFIRFFKKF